ncbi:spore protease YyaC [Caldibacillus lycopersici]|uniref:Spore protease YyaC n=1 Tax=Perspicuibacillus lycopersici TaxID=1325689 RepID=A0AAE3IRV9_9BACI|nr:spore protease YyaC [Perspicuibacillus lycopersici]MCU9613475.1 spore protease YyaC [Perspicuibacillus lycopersici]
MFKSRLFKGENDFKIHWNESLATNKIANELFSYFPLNDFTPIVFICIGTDRSTGDSLGPLVGTQLLNKHLPNNFYCYGTLDDPIHAVNLQEKLALIQQQFINPFIVGIDACLGQSQHVGTIQIKEGPLKPGAGVNKSLPNVGNIHMTGIVNISGFMEYFVLQNTRLNLVMNIATIISESIYKAGLLYTFDQKIVNSGHETQKDSL